MRILLLGATGFIGRHIASRLLRQGHEVVAGVRDTASARRRFPDIAVSRIDLERLTAPEQWLPLLDGIDGVVNCAGILQSGRDGSADAIHAAAPKALFDACARRGIRKIVQISAVSADDAAGTEYARTKKAADDYLRSLDLDWTVLRPSLVYAQGSFGGTSTLRGLAGLPFVMPLIGEGDQRFQPIHADDLAETVARSLTDPNLSHVTLDPVGPETLTLKDMLVLLRAWLDLPPARFLKLPMPLVAGIAKLGDIVGRGPMRSTALEQMTYGNVSDPAAFATAIGFTPRKMSDALRDAPSHVQDRWHARLYFLKPLLTLILILLWAGSGIAGLLNPPPGGDAILAKLGLPPLMADVFCLWDLLIAAALTLGWRPKLMGLAQLATVGSYTLGIGLLEPALWVDAYGPLLKNLPILAAIAAWMAMLDEK
ncbi:NAD(P)H-binding protein [Lacibacterium aquatile]|uniref:NAD(P)H-binding protein n=1 Tax=Lacibacterium aquatile TaxID=1168082 RepID=A0ABW5DVB0_9PROT